MADIFISYKREDRDWAEALSHALEEQGWTTWWDTSLHAGESFDFAIERELDAAKCVVVLWSKTSIKSRWVVAEAGEGLDRGVLVPVFIEQVRPPLVFRRIHSASLMGWKKGAKEKLFVDLVADVTRIVPAPSTLQEPEPKPATQKRERVRKPAVNAPAREITSQGIEFVLIPEGSFEMGSTKYDSEKPVHKVHIRLPFYMGKYPVTQAQWEKVMGSNPSHFKGSNRPVEKISWEDAQAFLKRLNEQENCNGCFRLATEAEWEYGARAGTKTAYSFGDDETQLAKYAWFSDNSGGETHPVGKTQPNPWGLYDMHGNVNEWVQDWYGGYSDEEQTDPVGPKSGSNRVFRGGGWGNDAGFVRSADRGRWGPGIRINDLGFRVVRTYP